MVLCKGPPLCHCRSRGAIQRRTHANNVLLLLALVFVFVRQLLFKEDSTVDDLIDVIEGNRRYVKCLYVYNKVSLGHHFTP